VSYGSFAMHFKFAENRDLIFSCLCSNPVLFEEHCMFLFSK